MASEGDPSEPRGPATAKGPPAPREPEDRAPGPYGRPRPVRSEVERTADDPPAGEDRPMPRKYRRGPRPDARPEE